MTRNAGLLALLAGSVVYSFSMACSPSDSGPNSNAAQAGRSAGIGGTFGGAGLAGNSAVGEGSAGTRGIVGGASAGGSSASAGGTGNIPIGTGTDRPALNDIRFWARSDQGVTVNGNNQVTGWLTIDGTFGAATLSTSPPTREAAPELGNKPVIRFESNLQQWAGWAGLAIGTKGDFSMTYVARVRHDPTQVNNEWYIVGNTATLDGTIRGGAAFYGNWDDKQPTVSYDGFDLRPTGGTGDFATRVNDKWRVHTYTREAATSNVRYWVDGYEHTDDWASTNWQNPTQSEAIVMIAAQLFALNPSSFQQLGNVFIAELIITSTNNVASIPALHAAMQKEYGIAGIAP